MRIFKKHNSIVIQTLFRKDEINLKGEVMCFISNNTNIVVKLHNNGCIVLDRHGNIVMDLSENDEFYVQNMHQKSEWFGRTLSVDLAMKRDGTLVQKIIKGSKLLDPKN